MTEKSVCEIQNVVVARLLLHFLKQFYMGIAQYFIPCGEQGPYIVHVGFNLVFDVIILLELFKRFLRKQIRCRAVVPLAMVLQCLVHISLHVLIGVYARVHR